MLTINDLPVTNTFTPLPVQLVYVTLPKYLDGIYFYRPGQPALIFINTLTPEVSRQFVIGDFFARVHVTVDPSQACQSFRVRGSLYAEVTAALDKIAYITALEEFNILPETPRLGTPLYWKVFQQFLADREAVRA